MNLSTWSARLGAGRARHRAVAACAEAWRRVRSDAWALTQRAAAATLAWVIALWIGDHPSPFFAPIAAVVALNTSFGERGLNALRLLLGVVLGIVVAEVTLLLGGAGYGGFALATFTAMVLARACGGAPLVVAQAAAGAILTVAVADGDSGIDRIVDALIGAGVALLFSQVLFTPEPLKLLHRAESKALADMAAGLRLTAHALAADDEESGTRAMQGLRDLRDRLADLGRTRTASTRVTRHSLAWRTRARPVVYERENAGQLDLLGGSCLLLTRTTLALDPTGRRLMEPAVRGAADLLAQLAPSPGDQPTRQDVVDRVPAAISVADPEAATDLLLTTALASLRLVGADLMVFAGVDPAEAGEALAVESGRLRISTPPDPGTPFAFVSALAHRIRRLARRPLTRRGRRRRPPSHRPGRG